MTKGSVRIVWTLLALSTLCVSLANAQAIKSGAAVKKPVFGGSGPNAGWGSIGVITQEAMKFYGWDVQICSACAGAERAARLVAAAAVPARGGPNDPPQPATPLDFGATGSQYLWWAYQGSHGFAKDPEGPHKQLRLIANIQSPSYLVVAVKADSEITDLAQIKEKRLPVRILTLMRDGDLALNVLAYYGLTKQVLESFGGSIAGSNPPDRNAFDIMIGFAAMDNMPEYEAWVDVTQRFNLRYLELPQELRSKLVKDSDWEQRTIPLGLFRGVDRPIPAVVRTGTVIYGRSDMPDDLAYTLARALDEHQDLLQWSNVTYSYNPFAVWKDFGVPLHPAAERYYRERGYLNSVINPR
jgi:TRAP transporter TAXI family solute receptor